jgi:hypothetical protein
MTLTLPSPLQPQPEPRWQSVSVGPFNLPGIKINPELWLNEDLETMLAWSREQGALINGDLIAWKKVKLRDWWILKWS